MARMIPVDGPLGDPNESPGERAVFYVLRDQLPDEFEVIHSVPWLTHAVREIDPRFAPTGEIDFVVMHPELGLLTLEVKSGRYAVHGAIFTLVRSNERVDVVTQLRRNFHGLTKWLGAAGVSQRFGYGLVFPHTSFLGQRLPPGLVDPALADPEHVVIGKEGMPRLGDRVRQLMAYWQSVLGTPALGVGGVEQLKALLCPAFDGTPTWAVRAATDSQLWLRLTAEQAHVVERVCRGERTLVKGWPGTGKTLIAVEAARRLTALGRNVLFLTFNQRLAARLKQQLKDAPACRVAHWHRYCAQARSALGRPAAAVPDTWLRQECLKDLLDAVRCNAMPTFDAVIVDEAQAFQADWLEALASHLTRGALAIFCDPTQRFHYEALGATVDDLVRITGVAAPFVLTQVARMPRAVTDRLLALTDLDVQMTSPRDLEPDTLSERVLLEGFSVESCITELRDRGFETAEIVVLSEASSVDGLRQRLASSGVEVATVQAAV